MSDGSIRQVFLMILLSPTILTMRPGAAPIVNGAIVIIRDRIAAVGPSDRIIKHYPKHRLYRLENAVLMPGLVNLHTHLELPPLRDAVRAPAFPDWVLNLVRAKKDLTANDYASAAAQNIKTLIRSGTTTVGEICTHGLSPELLKQSGLRAVIFHEMISMGPSSLVSRPSSFVPRPSSLAARSSSGLVRAGISPHAPYTVSKAVLIRIGEISRKKNLRLAMHVAESRDEIRLLQGKKSGFEKLYRAAGWDPAWAPSADSPVQYLHGLGLLSRNFLAVHAVQVTDRDIRLIRKTRTSVAHCPRSNRETGVGKMSLRKFLDAGIIVGLGTDSLASSPSLNMWDEMRYAYRVHRRDGVSALTVFTLATTGGASALGMGKETGSLEPGRRADVIAVRLPKKKSGDPYSDLLRETESCIMSVVNGKIIWTEPGFTIHDSRK
jgi:5-methylthioadenosine/S-adenosylhomocysteine deaminase